MIFARLDVCFWRRPKFALAGPAACGYWAAALAYLREHESPDGILPKHVLGMLLGLGEREARRLCEKLVSCSLFARRDDGYELIGYAAEYGAAQTCTQTGTSLSLRFRARNRCRRQISWETRKFVIQRDGLVCGLCRGPVELDDVHLDHVIPWARGGPDTADNLRVTHSRCNMARGAAPDGERSEFGGRS